MLLVLFTNTSTRLIKMSSPQVILYSSTLYTMSGSVSLRSREGRDDQRVVKRDDDEFLSLVAFFTFPGVPEKHKINRE